MTFNKGDVAMDNLNVGDVVQLNSGGPDMVVEKIDGAFITCSRSIEENFLLADLKKIKSDELDDELDIDAAFEATLIASRGL
jgi:hypothetical protein